MSILNPIDDGNCYGHVSTKGKNKGKLSRHKGCAVNACEVAHGPRPPGYVVRHLCDNDSMCNKRGKDAFICVNKDHIEWGTYKQNAQDAAHNMSAVKKGRKRKPFTQEHRDSLSAAMSAALKGKIRGPYKKRVTVVVSVEPV